jgi:propanol-preferring alcohol dehydrogenase
MKAAVVYGFKQPLVIEERRRGTLVSVGLPAADEIRLPTFRAVLNGTKVVGSIVGTRVDDEELFELHARGRTQVLYEKHPLDDVNDAIREVEEAKVRARLGFVRAGTR